MADEKPKLSDKQQVFVIEYLKDFNAAAAARRAGYSAATARQQGQRMLTNVDIEAAIQAAIDVRAMPSSEVLQRLAQQARGEQSKFFKVHRNQPYVDFDALIEAGLGHLIKKVKPTEHGVEVEFYDAQAALVHLGKHHKLFTDKVEHSGAGGGPIQTEDVTTYSGMDRGSLNRGIEAALKHSPNSE